MNRKKKPEGPSNPRNGVYVTINDEMRQWLEKERQRRDGDMAGVKLPQIIREKLARQLECEKKGARC